MAAAGRSRAAARSKKRKRSEAAPGGAPQRRRRGAARSLGGFPRASAEGLDARALRQLRRATGAEVRELGALAGVAHVILREGRCVLAHAEGWADVARGRRFGLDTLCSLHGCTKPLVVAAFLTLVDEGCVRLSDPIRKHAPFADVVRSGSRVRRAGSTPTLRHLLAMTGGLGYTGSPGYDELMKRVQRGRVADLATFCDELAELPLVVEPGRRYEYSFSTDLLGRVCEIVSGEPLEEFVRKRLLQPLGMKDTHFVVPKRKQQRVARLYKCEPAPRAKRRRGAQPFAAKAWDDPLSAPGILSAGGGILTYKDPGMLSTARDYARFCQMLLDGGVGPGRRRVLSEATVRLLWRDGLAPYARADGRVPGWNEPGPGRGYWDHVGWSLLGAHVTFSDGPREDGVARKGACMFMGGGGGAYWCIDARRRLVALSFSQSFGGGREGNADGQDGHGPRGNDAAPFARAAVDGSGVLLPHEYGRYGHPGIHEEEATVQIPLRDGAP